MGKEMKELVWGFSSDGELAKWDDVWEGIEDTGDTIMFQTKKTFKHEDECEFGDFIFEYKYVIRITDMWQFEADEEIDRFAMELLMVPLSKYVNPKFIENWEEKYGDFDRENIDVSFILDEMQCPIMKYETCNVNNNIDYGDWYTEELKDFLSKAWSAIKAIDRLKGFWLDRPQNRIGTTGWDYLKEFVFGVDAFQLTMDRYKDTEERG